MAGLADLLFGDNAAIGAEILGTGKVEKSDAEKPTYARAENVPAPKKSPRHDKPELASESARRPNYHEFIGENENDSRKGYKSKSGQWYPYEVGDGTEGKPQEYDVGRGLMIRKGKIEVAKNVFVDASGGLTTEQESKAFNYHVTKAHDEASKFKKLNLNQQAALADLIYQTGIGYFKGTKSYKAFKAYEKSGDPEDLKRAEFEAFDPDQGIAVKVTKGQKTKASLQKRVAKRRALFNKDF